MADEKSKPQLVTAPEKSNTGESDPPFEGDTSFADAMQEAAADGKLDAHRARPHVFGNYGPTKIADVGRAVHVAWGAAVTSRGPEASMLEGILRVADRAFAKGNEAALRKLYRYALELLRKWPTLDEDDPESEERGRWYPRRRYLDWSDWENALFDRLTIEASIGISLHGIAQLTCVWLLVAPAPRDATAKTLRAAIKKEVGDKIEVDGNGMVVADRKTLQDAIIAAMREAGIGSKGNSKDPNVRKDPFRYVKDKYETRISRKTK